MQLFQIETISEEWRTTFYFDVFRLPDIVPSNVLQCIIPGDESAVQRWSNGGGTPCQNMMRAWFKAGKRREQLWWSRWSIKRKFCFENTWVSGLFCAGLDWVDFRWMKDDSATCYVTRKNCRPCLVTMTFAAFLWSQNSYEHKYTSRTPEHA